MTDEPIRHSSPHYRFAPLIILAFLFWGTKRDLHHFRRSCGARFCLRFWCLVAPRLGNGGERSEGDGAGPPVSSPSLGFALPAEIPWVFPKFNICTIQGTRCCPRTARRSDKRVPKQPHSPQIWSTPPTWVKWGCKADNCNGGWRISESDFQWDPCRRERIRLQPRSPESLGDSMPPHPRPPDDLILLKQRVS